MAIELYSKATLDTLLAAKLSDAPSDGSTYGRKDGAWEIVAGGSPAWGSITGTVTDQTDLTTYLSSNYYSVSNPSGYITATVARRQGIVDGIRSIINDAGIGFDGGGYYFLPLNAGALNNPVNNGEFTSTGKWFAVWDGVGATYLPAQSVNVQSGVSTITFPLTSYPPSGYGLFYTEDGGSTWYESTFKL